MSHKKAGGSTRNGRDSVAKRLGVKVFGGESILPGGIIIRQKGTKYHPGQNVMMGRDRTIFSVTEGKVGFFEKRVTKYDGRRMKEIFVQVLPNK